MGIIYPDAKRLWEARQRGVSFRRTATLGHQSLYLHPREVRWFQRALAEAAPAVPAAPPGGPPLASYRFGGFADEFLRTFLGVEELTVIDNSAFEGAGFVHDMNTPVPQELIGSFDAVIDGGTLEHVFNFPVAVSNLMRMAKVGGTVFVTTPANNLCGHGFYQFSPELMFRVFAADNGFELREVTLTRASYPGVELTPAGATYRVTDPAVLGSRVGLVSGRPVLMMAEAVKRADVTPFAKAPQQSDYVVRWEGGAAKPGAAKPKKGGLARRVLAKLPQAVRNRVIGLVQNRRYSFANRGAFEKVG
jgi:hypothetical protein